MAPSLFPFLRVHFYSGLVPFFLFFPPFSFSFEKETHPSWIPYEM